jgi:hypothetical protein
MDLCQSFMSEFPDRLVFTAVCGQPPSKRIDDAGITYVHLKTRPGNVVLIAADDNDPLLALMSWLLDMDVSTINELQGFNNPKERRRGQ